ncbi:unnamed protein product [Notodromas monacha]|uniref:Tudor domain-containing protein n=1 Tax=Notodromas monacha TaxID=399045 RepID=A0A7R9G9S5_9CRUS|nr:unnamed protein product [Notodromas monacha]CAG0914587.1 unnamed protein product [Notodromas monacha]
MADDLAENLRTYKLQLSQVEAALIAEKDSAELLKLQADLKEVIELTTELIKNQVTTRESNTKKENDVYVPDDDEDLRTIEIQWKSGDQCLAPWSKDKTSGKLYRAVIEEVNEGGLCTIMFPKWGTPDVTLVTKLRPLPAEMRARLEAEEEEEEMRKATGKQFMNIIRMFHLEKDGGLNVQAL